MRNSCPPALLPVITPSRLIAEVPLVLRRVSESPTAGARAIGNAPAPACVLKARMVSTASPMARSAAGLVVVHGPRELRGTVDVRFDVTARRQRVDGVLDRREQLGERGLSLGQRRLRAGREAGLPLGDG